MAGQDKQPEEEEQESAALTYQDLPEAVQQVFISLLARFTPAAINEPCTKMTTQEILSSIVEHCQTGFPSRIVFDFLLEHKFLYDYSGGTFYWLMKEKR